MLYASLIVSAVVLAIYIYAYARSSAPLGTAIPASLAACILPMFLMCGLPLVWLQTIALFIGLGVATWFRARPRFYIGYACLATVAVYGWGCYHALTRHAELREVYPMESLAARLPGRPAPPSQPLSPAAENRLELLDEAVKEPPSHWYRKHSLEQLHLTTVTAFVNSPGFGVTRMPYVSEHGLKSSLREEALVAQPVPVPGMTWSASDLEREPKGVDTDSLFSLLTDSVKDFVNPTGFGLILDKRVAGFQSHQFSKLPAATAWKVQRIDLVGLVVHPTPVVYLTEELPRMDKLRTAPTRTPDAFEALGLAELRRGEDLFVRETESGIQLLGAIRSAGKCAECHGGNRGDLLGAFSYALTRADTGTDRR